MVLHDYLIDGIIKKFSNGCRKMGEKATLSMSWWIDSRI
uniref:Uncharacterized protein n=1 Tax=Arundo donax TaxID=35708 RepID=A0A0A9ED96_ARUDO